MKKPRNGKYRPGAMIVIYGQFVFAASPDFNADILEVFDAGLYTASNADESVYRQLANRFKMSMKEARDMYPNLQCKIVQPHQ